MQLSQFNSNKTLQCPIKDPYANIFAQLRQCNSKVGDYARIISREVDFQPIYKITKFSQSKFVPDSSFSRKSISKDYLSGQNPQLKNKLMNQNPEKSQLSFGSQIFIKNISLERVKVEVIKPYFPQLYVKLSVKGKGYVSCKEESIHFSKTLNLQNEGIWMCMRVKEDQNENLLKYPNLVKFCNFKDNIYLYLQASGVLNTSDEERATTFSIRSIDNLGNFILTGTNILSQLITNKSKSQIKKIIDNNLDRNQGKRRQQQLEIEMQISPVEDSQITILMQLNYSIKVLKQDPSLKLIKNILDELIYYDIPEFIRNNTLMSEHLEKLLYDNQIMSKIATFIELWYDHYKEESHIEVALPHRLSNHSEKNRKKAKTAINSDTNIQNILKIISDLCRTNQKNSYIFQPLLSELIKNQSFQLASILLKQNQYFASKFFKNGWYNQLYSKIIQSSKKQMIKYINFLRYFCEGADWWTLNPSKLHYKQIPSTNNQYLIFHSIRSSDYKRRVFQFQLYSQGLYVFIHDNKSGKDVQFNTFIEGSSSQNSINQLEKGQKSEILPSYEQMQQDIQVVVTQLKLIHSLCKNYNINIIYQLWTLIYALAPYCFRNNFPNITNLQLKKLILQLVVVAEPSNVQAIVHNRSLVNFTLKEGEIARSSIEEMGDLKNRQQNFGKNMRKKAQQSRKLLKQLGQHFLQKCKQWKQNFKKKEWSAEFFQKREEHNLIEWFQIMIQVMSLRLFKVKEKKEGQLLGYIKKLFQTVEDKKDKGDKKGQEDCNLIVYFADFVLEMLKFNPRHDKYLQTLKIKKNYEGKLRDQLNKVIINTFQNKTEITFIRPPKDFTKIQFIDIFVRRLEGETSKQSQQQLLTIKIVIVRLIQLIIMNVNQEMVDESVETLNYLVKNPSNIFNLSSFNLLEMIPTYPFQNQTKKIVIEQWYLSYNCHLFNQLTTVLRLIYQKKIIFRRSINDILLIDKTIVLPVYHHMIAAAKNLKRMSKECQSWLRPSLLIKYAEPYEEVLQYLQNLVESLQKMKQCLDREQLVKIIQNNQIVHSLTSFLQYFADYYLQTQDQNNFSSSRMQNSKNDKLFVTTKLNPLSKIILRVLIIYITFTKNDSNLRFKIILNSLGDILSSIHMFIPTLMEMYQIAFKVSSQCVFDALRYTSSTTLVNLMLNMPFTWQYFKLYLTLQDEQLLVATQRLLGVLLNQLEQSELSKFHHSFIQSSLLKGLVQSNQLDSFSLNHQTIFMKLAIKMMGLNCHSRQFLDWFMDNIFYEIIEEHKHSITRNMYNKAILTQEQIQKRQLITYISYWSITNQHKLQTQKSLSDSQFFTDWKQASIQFVLDQVNQFKEMFDKTMRDDDWKLNTINKDDSMPISYIQYLAFDLTLLAFRLEILAMGEVKQYLKMCCTKLKQFYKMKVVDRKNDENSILLQRIDQIIFYQVPEDIPLNMRKIHFEVVNSDSSRSDIPTLPKNKPLRKWSKAVAELNRQNFIQKSSQLFEDIIDFDNIFQFKNQSPAEDIVINHSDITFKLLETSLNLKRLQLSIQNQIFILQQLYMLGRSKQRKKRKDIDIGYMMFGLRMFDHIVDNQMVALYKNRGNQYIYDIPKWQTNIYCLSLQLQIISMSRFFQAHPQREQYFVLLSTFLKMSVRNYQSDIAYLQLYFQTLHSTEQIQIFNRILPFQTIIDIIVEQIEFSNLPPPAYQMFGIQIAKADLLLPDYESMVSKYSRGELQKLVERMDKVQFQEIQQQLNKIIFYKTLLEMKNQ